MGTSCTKFAAAGHELDIDRKKILWRTAYWLNYGATAKFAQELQVDLLKLQFFHFFPQLLIAARIHRSLILYLIYVIRTENCEFVRIFTAGWPLLPIDHFGFFTEDDHLFF